MKDKDYRSDIFESYIINQKETLLNSYEIIKIILKGCFNTSKEKFFGSIDNFENKTDKILLVIEQKISEEEKNEYVSQIFLYYFEKLSHIFFENYFKTMPEIKEKEKNLIENGPLKIFQKCFELLSKINTSKSKIKNVSKLLYIGYIRVFLYKFEEFIRENSNKLEDKKKIFDEINSKKNHISFMVELFFYKIIYNKNNKDINIFYTKNNIYNIELLNNYNDFFKAKINDDNSLDENDEKENPYIDLLEEKINKFKIKEQEYPFYKYFYYSDYIDENYLNQIINNEDSKNYPVLMEYLSQKNNDNILNNFYIYNYALNSINEEFSSKITRENAQKEIFENTQIYKENSDLFNQFFEIYNKLSDNNNDNDEDEEEIENKINVNNDLNPKLPIVNFLFVDENEYFKKFKNFYERFINKHNKIVEKLFNAKKGFILNQSQNKMKVQNVTKENEIFVIKNNISFHDLIFNNSYRKVIISKDYSDFNKYEINYEFIEEFLTNELLKNKKLFDDELFEFNYKNEDLEFKNKDICTIFKSKINEEDLSINDKIIFYQYFEKNKGSKGDANLHLRLLDDFSYLIKFSSESVNKKENLSQTNIYKFIEGLENISKEFKEIFKAQDNLTINKLVNIYEYYQILCFDKVKENLYQYQNKIKNEEQINMINNYIRNNSNTNIKNIFGIGLRKFILCFLAKEINKEDKIKLNNNNIKNYLEIEDLWDQDFYDKKKKNEFYQEIKIFKKLDIRINNVIPFYDLCFSNMYKNYFDDVKAELKSREEERIRNEKEKEKQDLSNFNANDMDVEENQIEVDNNNKNEEKEENKEKEKNNENQEDEDPDDYDYDKFLDKSNSDGEYNEEDGGY